MSEPRPPPDRPKGALVKFKKEKKKDKLKKLLGDNLLGVTTSGGETILHLKANNLSSSDIDKIQKIVDGE
jgi:hypothetical protein